MTQYIKAPFNFVPLNEKVFFPDWADQISHDIPFSDGESGEIEIELEAMTPVFVRNGHNEPDSKLKTDNYISFSKDENGNYFIPGTSIKGMLRNVLEIISFGKMDQVSNDRFAFRDLQNKKYLSFFQNSDVCCGWMTKINENTVSITNHGIPRRISHSELDRIWNTDFSTRFKDSKLLKDDSNRTALYKIKLAKNKDKIFKFNELPLNPQNIVDKRIKVEVNSNGALKGTIVLTGQPSARKDHGDIDKQGRTIFKGEGKRYEFVFPENEVGEPFSLDTEIEGDIYKDFCFVNKGSTDWIYWRKKLENGTPVPIFFSIKNSKLIHFGLSYLYKLPFHHRVKDFIPSELKSPNFDLPDSIFGKSKKNSSVKGRVQIGNSFLVEGTISNQILKPYMGSPKPTYYPIYLVQKGRSGIPSEEFKTMYDNDAKLKGRKRYPVHETVNVFTIPDKIDEVNLNHFKSINAGSKFKCKIKFFNLKKVEIGALLCSLILKNHGFHSLGFAKAYGYGRIKTKISEIRGLSENIENYLSAFHDKLKTEINGYEYSDQIKEFNSMTMPQRISSSLEYMELSEFVECKKQNFKKSNFGEYLDYYSELIVKQPTTDRPATIVDAEIVFIDKRMIKARLLEGRDISSKELKDYPEKVRLKIGDRILVKGELKGGKIISLKFQKLKE